jgi:poly-gamma-glutamate capsule biosynthesis protein CapA/YwtB (metallophosphatase superfamily)
VDPRAERRERRRAQIKRRRQVAVALLTLALLGAAALVWTSLGGGSPSQPAAKTPAAKHKAKKPATTPTTPITISWVGDIVLGSSFGMPPNGGRDSLAGVRRSLKIADLTTGNLEQTLSVGGDSKCGPSSTDCFAFQAPPSFARLLTAAGFDLMNLANNHAFDFGAPGLAQTRSALKRAHVRWTGGPGQITVLGAKGVRVAFVGFASYPWSARIENIAAAQRLVRKAAKGADLVVVAFHGGAEGSDKIHVPYGAEYFLGENRGDLRRFTHALIDAGADLVVGSGPHVIRGVEWYHGRLIAYSAGNFAGYHNFGLGGTLSLSAIFRVTLRPDGSFVKGRWVPVRLVGPGLPQLDSSKASLRLVSTLSREDFGARGARFMPDGKIRARG